MDLYLRGLMASLPPHPVSPPKPLPSFLVIAVERLGLRLRLGGDAPQNAAVTDAARRLGLAARLIVSPALPAM
jgi:hypothetical protein